eukprot:scaffold2119_cov153-Skeletonema_marinoi.AAC.1
MSSQRKTPEKSQPQASPAVQVTTSAATRGKWLSHSHDDNNLIVRREAAVHENADDANNQGSLMLSPPVLRRHSHQQMHYLSSSHEPEEECEIETHNGTQETISALTTTRQLKISQAFGDKWCNVRVNAAASERVHNNNESNGAKDTEVDDDGGAAAAKAAEEIEQPLDVDDHNNHHAWNLFEGVVDEDVSVCFEYLGNLDKNMDNDAFDEFVSNFPSAETLTKHAKYHAHTQQLRYNLRTVLTKTRALEEKVLNDGGKDDTHLIKAILTTENVDVSEMLNCMDICRPESWLKDHQHFGQTKGIYFAVWGRDPVLDDDLRIRFEEEFQREEFSHLSDDIKEDIRRLFSCVRNESKRDDRLLRVKVGMILDEYLFQRIKTLHQSEGRFAQMIFIGTNDLCDDKVKELEDLLKYACYRCSLESFSGRHMSCLAGVSSEVFYMHQNVINAFIEEAEEFVKTGSFCVDIPSVHGETAWVTIRETDIDNPNNPHWRQFCLKTNRRDHKPDCEYRNGTGEVSWQKYARSLDIQCKCSGTEEIDVQDDLGSDEPQDEELQDVQDDLGSDEPQDEELQDVQDDLGSDEPQSDLVASEESQEEKNLPEDIQEVVRKVAETPFRVPYINNAALEVINNTRVRMRGQNVHRFEEVATEAISESFQKTWFRDSYHRDRFIGILQCYCYAKFIVPGETFEPWSECEDLWLLTLVVYGRQWSEFATHLPFRDYNQCMSRWSYLEPNSEYPFPDAQFR